MFGNRQLTLRLRGIEEQVRLGQEEYHQGQPKICKFRRI